MPKEDSKLVEALEDLPSWEIMGITDPLGQLGKWLWDQISGAFDSVSKAVQGWINGAVGSITSWISNNLKGVLDFAKSIGTAFSDFVKDPLGQIKKALDYVWSITPTWIKDPLSTLGSWLSQAGQALIDFVKDPVGKLKALADWIWSITPSWIKDPLSRIGDFLKSIGAAFLDFAKDPVGVISKGLKWLSDALSPAVSSLQEGVKKLGDLVAAPVEAISKGVGDILSVDITKWISDAFTGAVKTLGDAFISQVVDPVSKTIEDYIIGPIKAGLTGIWDFLKAGATNLGTWLVKDAPEAISGALSWISNQVQSLFSSFFSTLSNAAKALLNIKPEDSFTGWVTQLAPLALIPIGIGGAISAAQLKVAGCGLDLSPLWEAISSAVDSRTLITPIISALVGATIGVAAQRYANKTARPSLPPLSDAYRMLNEGLISSGEWQDIGAYWGFSESYITRYKDLWDWDPTFDSARSLAGTIELDDTFINEAFKVSGIPDRWQSYLRKYLALLPLSAEIRSYVSSLVSFRAEGYTTKDGFNADLAAAQSQGWIKAKEVELRKLQAEKQFARNLLDQQISTERYKFRRGIIDASTLEANLVSLGLDPTMANAIKENEVARAGMA
jgi:hypothetical protein